MENITENIYDLTSQKAFIIIIIINWNNFFIKVYSLCRPRLLDKTPVFNVWQHRRICEHTWCVGQLTAYLAAKFHTPSRNGWRHHTHRTKYSLRASPPDCPHSTDKLPLHRCITAQDLRSCVSSYREAMA